MTKNLKLTEEKNDPENIKNFLRSQEDRLVLYAGKENSLLLFKFLLSLNRTQTRKAYFFDLMDFFEFLHRFQSTKELSRVNRSLIDHFKEVLKRGKLKNRIFSNSTVKRKITAVSRFYIFLICENIVSHNPCLHVSRPSVPLEVKTSVISKKDFHLLLNSLDLTKKNYYLYRALLLVLFTTGLRVGELVSLRWNDYVKDSQFNTLNVYSFKSQKNLYKNLNSQCVDALEELHFFYSHRLEGFNSDSPLFISMNSKLIRPLTSEGVRYILKNMGFKAGLKVKLTPHVARTFYITQGLEVADIGLISRDVGHSSTVMTNEYDKRRRNISHDVSSFILS